MTRKRNKRVALDHKIRDTKPSNTDLVGDVDGQENTKRGNLGGESYLWVSEKMMFNRV